MTTPEEKFEAAKNEVVAAESKIKTFFRAHLTWIIAGACFVAGTILGHLWR